MCIRDRHVAEALGVWRDGMSPAAAAREVAGALDGIYTKVGVPTRVSQLDILKDDLINIARETVKNFNANRGARSPDEQVADALKLLEAAW